VNCHLFGAKGQTIDNLRVANCRFSETAKSPPDDRKWQGCKFQNCTVSNIGFHNCTFEKADLTNLAIYQSSASHIRFRDCRFLESGSWCIDLEPAHVSVGSSEIYPVIEDVVFDHCLLDCREAGSGNQGLSIALLSSKIAFRKCIFMGGKPRLVTQAEGDNYGKDPRDISFKECIGFGSGVDVHKRGPSAPNAVVGLTIDASCKDLPLTSS
jgi:hypothetical protein